MEITEESHFISEVSQKKLQHTSLYVGLAHNSNMIYIFKYLLGILWRYDIETTETINQAI